MFEVYEHNKRDCIKLLNMIICEIPFIKSFSDDCLLERLLNLICIISNAFDNNQSFDFNALESDEEREHAIREWLLRHYNAKCFIDDLDFNDCEDRTRVSVLIINILFKLRHSLKDIEQYLKDCDSFVQFDRQLNDITRFDKLLEMVEMDSNKWKTKAREYKVKFDESKKLMDRYQQNEIFNYNCNPRNQNLYKSRISLAKPVADVSHEDNHRNRENDSHNSCQPLLDLPEDNERHLLNGFDSEDEDKSGVNNVDISHLCVECDERFGTNYEFNLHFLKVHRNVDISHIIRNTDINIDINDIISKSDSKKCNKTQRKKSFKCIHWKCGKTFIKSHDLKNHFISRHQIRVDRLLGVYSDSMNAALNRIRTPVPNAKHVFIDNNYTFVKNRNNYNFNNNEINAFNSIMNGMNAMNESQLTYSNITCEPDLMPVPFGCDSFSCLDENNVEGMDLSHSHSEDLFKNCKTYSKAIDLSVKIRSQTMS